MLGSVYVDFLVVNFFKILRLYNFNLRFTLVRYSSLSCSVQTVFITH